MGDEKDSSPAEKNVTLKFQMCQLPNEKPEK